MYFFAPTVTMTWGLGNSSENKEQCALNQGFSLYPAADSFDESNTVASRIWKHFAQQLPVLTVIFRIRAGETKVRKGPTRDRVIDGVFRSSQDRKCFSNLHTVEVGAVG